MRARSPRNPYGETTAEVTARVEARRADLRLAFAPGFRAIVTDPDDASETII